MGNSSAMTRLARGVFVVGALAVAASACGGGSKKKVEEPTPVDAEPVATEDDEPVVSDQQYMEIKAFFDRKRRIVARCFGDAMDAGEVDKNAKGRVTVKVTIGKDGTLSDVSITHSNLKSKLLETCIVGKVRKWTVVTLPKAIDYTYMFGFERL